MSIYESNNEFEANSARVKLEYFIKEGKVFELKARRYTRSLRQNSALHKFFEMISTHLNDLGIEYMYQGPMEDTVSLMYTPELVKEFFWKPIQKTLYNTDSTTDLDTHQINAIVDVITKFFGEKGVYVEFPRKQEILNENKDHV